MLLYTNTELDMITDVEMYQMFEKGIRGGLAQCSMRYAQANNKYMKCYDKNDLNFNFNLLELFFNLLRLCKFIWLCCDEKITLK